jgi:hypothetical protein
MHLPSKNWCPTLPIGWTGADWLTIESHIILRNAVQHCRICSYWLDPPLPDLCSDFWLRTARNDSKLCCTLSCFEPITSNKSKFKQMIKYACNSRHLQWTTVNLCRYARNVHHRGYSTNRHVLLCDSLMCNRNSGRGSIFFILWSNTTFKLSFKDPALGCKYFDHVVMPWASARESAILQYNKLPV